MDGLMIREAAAEPGSAERPALIGEGLTLSFRALGERAAVVGGALEARGIKAGSRVALLADNSVRTVIVLHALIDLGATLVPLHPRLTPAEAALLLADAAPELLLRDEDLPALEASSAAPARSPSIALDPELPLAMVYTSGTTGRPKGAVLSRRAFLASAEASAANLGWIDDDRWLLCLPLCHVGGLSILTRCLLARRAIILEPRFEPRAVLAAIDRHRATMLSVVPTMLRDLLEQDQEGLLPRLRVLLSGGAGTPAALREACAHRGVTLLTTYGLTEACSQIASQRPASPPRSEPGSGRALPGAELRIVGEDEVGPIQVRGPMLMSGYWRGEGKALDRATDAEGWFETGDLGSLDEAGRLHVASRRSDLVITGGENVYPLEVEQVIETLPFVRAALVFGIPDERWGQIVAVALEIEAESALDEGQLTALLAARLAPHKRPRRFCVLPELPRKGPGKLDRAGVAERYLAMLRPLPPR